MIDQIKPTKLDNIGAYLRHTYLIDFDDHGVSLLASAVAGETREETVRQAFEMVRDRYPHSCDARKDEVACSASDVIRLGHGLCYAKSMLLAALLRYNGIPAGFCYERIRQEAGGFVLHGLNTVLLEGKWKKIDARGNNDHVHVTWSRFHDMLAYPPDTSAGGLELPGNYPDPRPEVVQILLAGPDISTVLQKLPGDLPL
ncbi:MAG TPA: transglutaminase family protein [Methanocella sp.]|nr:transglutaminase family protein [Methanocella sp.]